MMTFTHQTIVSSYLLIIKIRLTGINQKYVYSHELTIIRGSDEQVSVNGLI